MSGAARRLTQAPEVEGTEVEAPEIGVPAPPSDALPGDRGGVSGALVRLARSGAGERVSFGDLVDDLLMPPRADRRIADQSQRWARAL